MNKRIQVTKTGPIEEGYLEEVSLPIPKLSDNEVLVQVDSCGVCYRDLIDREGGNSFLSVPIALGHEIAGTIVDSTSSSKQKRN